MISAQLSLNFNLFLFELNASFFSCWRSTRNNSLNKDIWVFTFQMKWESCRHLCSGLSTFSWCSWPVSDRCLQQSESVWPLNRFKTQSEKLSSNYGVLLNWKVKVDASEASKNSSYFFLTNNKGKIRISIKIDNQTLHLGWLPYLVRRYCA